MSLGEGIAACIVLASCLLLIAQFMHERKDRR